MRSVSKLYLPVSLFVSVMLLLFASGCPDTPPSSPCDDVVCDDPPAPTCDGDVVVVYAAQGTCNAGECEYPETRTACAADHTCVDAECVPTQTGPACEGVVCDDPPADHCDEGVLMHSATGACEEQGDVGVCVYTFSETDCGAQEEACVVEGGVAACVDLCEGVDCPSREDRCENDSAYSYGGATGECAYQTGECEYPAGDETITACESDTMCQLAGDGTASCVPGTASGSCELACSSDEECGGEEVACVLLEPAEGAFCLATCADSDECGEGYSCSQITSVDDREASACVPDEGYCTQPSCFVGSACAHPVCEGHFACEPGFNFDFENWIQSDPPAGFEKSHRSEFSVTEETRDVNTGNSAGRVESSAGTNNRDLRVHPANLLPAEWGETYTLHQWNHFEEGQTGWYRIGLTVLDENGDRIGDRHFGEITSAHEGWLESTVTAPVPPEMPPVVDIFLKPFLRVRHQSSSDPGEISASVVALTDDWAVTKPRSFRVDSAQLDRDIPRVSGGRTYIAAAFNNEGVLYVATNLQGHDQSEDRILFVWVGGVGRGIVAYPMGKVGTVAGPSTTGGLLALTQNETTGRCHWLIFDRTSANPTNPWVALGDGAICPARVGNYLVGTVDLAGIMEVEPSDVPAALGFAAGAFSDEHDSTLIRQLPDTVTDNGNIDTSEIEGIHRAWILAGKIHP